MRITEKDGKFYKLKPEQEVYGWENGIRLVQIVGQFEDVKELIERMHKEPVYYKLDNGNITYDFYTHSNILYSFKTNEIEIYEYDFIASYKVEEYGITWWLKKDKDDQDE